MICEYEPVRGSAKPLAQVILSQIPIEEEAKMSYTHEDMAAHYITHKARTGETSEDNGTDGGEGDGRHSGHPMGVTFIVVSRGSVSRRSTFILLMQLEKQYDENAGKINVVELRALCEKAETGQNDTVGLARTEIDQVKNIMMENVERVLERGERINLLVAKTDKMNNSAVAFRKRSTAVQRRMRWQNVKLTAIFSICGIGLLYMIMGIECGLPGFQQCF